MQIILLEKVVNLGNLGDIVKVKGRLRSQLPDPPRPRTPCDRSQTRPSLSSPC